MSRNNNVFLGRYAFKLNPKDMTSMRRPPVIWT